MAKRKIPEPKIIRPDDVDPNTGVDAHVLGNAVPMDNQGHNLVYDNELLDAHFVTGDGQVLTWFGGWARGSESSVERLVSHRRREAEARARLGDLQSDVEVAGRAREAADPFRRVQDQAARATSGPSTSSGVPASASRGARRWPSCSDATSQATHP